MGILTGGTVCSLKDTQIPTMQRKTNTMVLDFFFLLPCSLLKVSHLLQGQFNKIGESRDLRIKQFSTKPDFTGFCDMTLNKRLSSLCWFLTFICEMGIIIAVLMSL